MYACYTWVPMSISRDGYKFKSMVASSRSQPGKETDKRKVAKQCKDALHPRTLSRVKQSSTRSRDQPHLREELGSPHCKGDSWTKSSFRQMKRGILSREMGICNSTETFNSIVHLRSHEKVKSTVGKSFETGSRTRPWAPECLLRSLDFIPWSIGNHSTVIKRLD